MTVEEYRIIEFVKCAKDPVYYLNTYGKVFNAKKQSITDMECFSYQEDCVRKFLKYQNNIVLKSRQTGMSVVAAGFVAWTLLFRDNQRILIIANDGEGAIRFLDTVKQFIDYTPEWLTPGPMVKNNQKNIELPNKSWAKAKASSPNAGRGESPTMLILDETAFIKDDEAIWVAAGTALSQTRGKCLMISTPFGTGNLYHSIWTGALKGENDFVRSEVHWSQNPFASEGLEWRIDELTGQKIPWSPWYEKECIRLKWNKVKIAQELDLSFEGSAALAIDNHVLDKYDKMCRNAKPVCYYDHRKMGDKFVDYETKFIVWEKPRPGGNYIIGGDVARGDGTDYSTLQVIDADTFTQVAEYQEKISPDLFAQVIYDIGMDYNEAYLAIECNSFGLATTLELKNKMGYKNMFHSKSAVDLYDRINDYRAKRDDKIPGFQTTKHTRPILINNLALLMREGNLKINSKRLMEEFRTLIINGDGRIEHAKGYNDDLIFAIGIAMLVRETEFESVFKSKQAYKSMLDAITNTSSLDEFPRRVNNVKLDKKKLIENDSFIFFGNDSGSNSIGNGNFEDLDDVSWLMG